MDAGGPIWTSTNGKMDPVPSPIVSQATLTDSEAGDLYIKTHTAKIEDGEIHGPAFPLAM